MSLSQAEIADDIRRERAEIEWFSESLEHLQQEFSSRYIAVLDRRVIDSDEDFETLLVRVRAHPGDQDVRIRFVAPPGYVWTF